MNILFISQYFYPENFRGNDIIFELANKGHRITVLTAKPNYPEGKFYKGYNFFNKSKEIIKGVTVVRTPIIPRGNGNIFNLFLNYFSFVIFSFFKLYFLPDEKYDIVFTQQLSPVTGALPGVWAKKRKKAPMVIWVLDLWPESVRATTNIKNKYFYKFLNLVVQYIYCNSEKILISSRSFEPSIIAKLYPYQKEIIYFPNWAEDLYGSEIVFEYQLPPLPDGFNIMYAGNIGEAQDFESILKAAKLTENDNINWLLLGNGRKLTWIQEYIISNNLTNVFLLGQHPVESMPIFFNRASVMLVSLKNHPIFSLTAPAKIQSYMAAGKVILSMLDGEGKGIIEDAKCGFSVMPGDYESLAIGARFLKSKSILELQKMGVNARKYYLEHFNRTVLIDKVECIFEEQIKSMGENNCKQCKI